MKNIAVVIDVYSKYGGASKSAYNHSKRIREMGYNSFMACNNTPHGESLPNDVNMTNSVKLCEEFLEKNKIEVMHYFKASKSLKSVSLFIKFIQALKKYNRRVRIIITVCQQPSYPGAILTPFEIKHADHIVFIDKTAFNDPLYSFIPERMKSMIYLLGTKEDFTSTENIKNIKKTYDVQNDTIIFGRGSTLNKCPKDVIDVYDKIQSSHKKQFVIVGVPKEKNWLLKKIIKRGKDDIITHPMMLPSEFEEIISRFDVLLYYLPPKMYSSIDGSLMNAMRLGVPVIVYGPPAPKELVLNGINGYVANTKEELIIIAEKLAEDEVERERIGKNARKLFFENLPQKNWSVRHVEIIEKMFDKDKEKIIIMSGQYFKIYIEKYLFWLKAVVIRLLEKIF